MLLVKEINMFLKKCPAVMHIHCPLKSRLTFIYARKRGVNDQVTYITILAPLSGPIFVFSQYQFSWPIMKSLIIGSVLTYAWIVLDITN